MSNSLWKTKDIFVRGAWCVAKLKVATHLHWFNALKSYYALAGRLSPSQADYLRKYFEWRYETNQTTPPPEFEGPWKNEPKEPTSRHYRGDNRYHDPYVGKDPLDPREFITIKMPNGQDIDLGKVITSGHFTSQQEFNPMSQLKFKTIYTLNGVDVSSLSSDQIYAAIKVEEDRIEKLKQIKNQPKKLKNEIAAAEEQLNQFIGFLDSQEAK